ncbi:flagellar biosynthesis anti-sigma factor FlgM [Hahella sp. CCB-MM4]|uniref:flagellar biosynthesis anti-sigma factor FlgM n=1 Tax=Hahella sp. (strain CCB-MM4) TaxID=1926491 RepID=UPI000B9C05FE|nr:flagellar biosynthesis anti-sigma factor FlgM [Hahella sp. CCB-MM4]
MNIKGVGSPPVNDLKARESLKNAEKPADNPQQAKTDAPAATKSGETVQLSSEAQGIRKVEQELAKLPDVDNERVAKIKQALEDGSYNINPRSVAEKLLGLDQEF